MYCCSCDCDSGEALDSVPSCPFRSLTCPFGDDSSLLHNLKWQHSALSMSMWPQAAEMPPAMAAEAAEMTSERENSVCTDESPSSRTRIRIQRRAIVIAVAQYRPGAPGEYGVYGVIAGYGEDGTRVQIKGLVMATCTLQGLAARNRRGKL